MRTDSLAATLDRIALDLGSQSALIDQHLRETGLWPIKFDADRLFYQVKGRLYAYHMLLQELGAGLRPGDPAEEQRAERLVAAHGHVRRGRD